ncbi:MULTISPECIES: hypothetical protein [Sphingobacterium]|uniref:hypothetical protein n=1 Tax=Sphingobacterium TaxID=28453 RepID=UPI0008A64EDF|nr:MULTISPECIES: hypothetical protein [Sphingobacterium]MBB1642716.1 hypothetical protein [Sphingobacterium sp. UME9]OFV09581.1 hypothetical protein HMPREF3127_23235 [Sphingobacterium sp. HMSC13C05]HAL50733.1 hypothetical protein [Sphingobacterium sp.]
MKKIIFFAAIIAVSIIICKQYPEAQQQSLCTLRKTKLGSTLEVNKAVANPFDFAGEIHNRGL